MGRLQKASLPCICVYTFVLRRVVKVLRAHASPPSFHASPNPSIFRWDAAKAFAFSPPFPDHGREGIHPRCVFKRPVCNGSRRAPICETKRGPQQGGCTQSQHAWSLRQDLLMSTTRTCQELWHLLRDFVRLHLAIHLYQRHLGVRIKKTVDSSHDHVLLTMLRSDPNGGCVLGNPDLLEL